MSSATIENILAQVNQLPPSERRKLIAALTSSEKARTEGPWSRVISTNGPYNDRTLEYEWLAKHRREYIGQWIALKGDQLIAHGPVAKEVFARADECGVDDAMFLFVEDPDIPFVNV
jgi:hypothetical protein